MTKVPKFYYRPDLNTLESVENPSPLREERTEKKADPTANAVYTSRLDQVAYPKAGSAPAEKKAKALSDAAIQKRLNKLRGPHIWDQIYDGMSPHEKGSWNAEQRKKGMNGKTAEPINKVNAYEPVKYDERGYPDKATPKQIGALAERMEQHRQMTGSDGRYDKPKPKKINPYADVKIEHPIVHFPLPERSAADAAKAAARAAALERMRAYAFKPAPNPDAVKGIGSFANVIGRKLRAANSKSDWEKRVNYKYKDNTNA